MVLRSKETDSKIGAAIAGFVGCIADDLICLRLGRREKEQETQTEIVRNEGRGRSKQKGRNRDCPTGMRIREKF